MSLSMDEMVYGPLYDVLGVPAVLTPNGGIATDVSAIDKTRGAEITDLNIDVMSVRPVAALRASELAAEGVALDDLDDGTITLNGTTWTIDAHLEKPSISGDGEVWLILIAGGA